MLELLVLLVWAVLSVPVFINGLFKQCFFAQEVVSGLCSATGLTFCPGLFAVVQAATPPTIEIFKSLPTDRYQRWAVYVIVLEKDGAITLVYLGSGTHATQGVTNRWCVYDRLDFALMPEYVIKAIRDGYTITYKGTLVWCPIPSAADVPMTRLLFIAMEAAFTFLFWTLQSRKSDHKMI